MFGSENSAATPEWQLALRVVASQHFARSAFLTNFLLYVCDRKLRGHEHEISEYQIGVEALGRPANYHPGEDNIVRNYARMLRKRLEEYFAEEGSAEPIRIVIPRGQYIPTFEPNSSAPSVEVQGQLSSKPPETKSVAFPEIVATVVAPHPRWQLPAIGLIMVAALGAGLLYRYFAAKSGPAIYKQFCRQLFSANRQTFVVTGDSGFAMLQDMTGHEVPLQDYVAGNWIARFSSLPISPTTANGTFGADRFSNYTSTADLSVVTGLAQLPCYGAARVAVRYARDVHMDDIKQANLVLIGGPRANPWVELLEPRSDFRMEFPAPLIGQHMDARILVNKHPRPGEPAQYSNIGTNPDLHSTYTLLSFLPNIDGSGWALLLEGQNMAGTEAAGEFITSEQDMIPALRKARRADGSIGSFELVLESRTVGANATEPRIVEERYGGS